MGLLEVDAEPAIDGKSGRNVADREIGACDKRPGRGEMGIEEAHLPRPFGDACLDDLRVAVGRHLHLQPEKHGPDGAGQVGRSPIHPGLHLRAGLELGRI